MKMKYVVLIISFAINFDTLASDSKSPELSLSPKATRGVCHSKITTVSPSIKPGKPDLRISTNEDVDSGQDETGFFDTGALSPKINPAQQVAMIDCARVHVDTPIHSPATGIFKRSGSDLSNRSDDSTFAGAGHGVTPLFKSPVLSPVKHLSTPKAVVELQDRGTQTEISINPITTCHDFSQCQATDYVAREEDLSPKINRTAMILNGVKYGASVAFGVVLAGLAEKLKNKN